MSRLSTVFLSVVCSAAVCFGMVGVMFARDNQADRARSVSGCMRTALSNADNAENWQSAALVRAAAGDTAVAAAYQRNAYELAARSLIPCRRVFPMPFHLGAIVPITRVPAPEEQVPDLPTCRADGPRPPYCRKP